MNEVIVPSPAKVNLFLEIIGRRPDGYHDIASIMQLVDLCDEVRLRRRRTGIRVEVQGAELPAGRGNLAYRAAALLLEAAGVEGGGGDSSGKAYPGGMGLVMLFAGRVGYWIEKKVQAWQLRRKNEDKDNL